MSDLEDKLESLSRKVSVHADNAAHRLGEAIIMFLTSQRDSERSYWRDSIAYWDKSVEFWTSREILKKGGND